MPPVPLLPEPPAFSPQIRNPSLGAKSPLSPNSSSLRPTLVPPTSRTRQRDKINQRKGEEDEGFSRSDRIDPAPRSERTPAGWRRRGEASARPPPRGRSQTLPGFAYLPRWTPASRQPPSVADGRVPEALVSWDWGRASGLWAGVCLSGSLKGFRRESGARVRTPRSTECLWAPTRGFPHLLEGKQLAEPSGRRTMEGNELEIISVPSPPRPITAPLFVGLARGACHSHRALPLSETPRESTVASPNLVPRWVPFISLDTVRWKGEFCLIHSSVNRHPSLPKANTPIFPASGPSTTRVTHISNLHIPNLLPNSSVPSPVPLSVAQDPLRYDHPGFLRSRPRAGDPAPGSPSGDRGRKEGYRPRRSPHLHPRPRHPGQIKEPSPRGERDPAPLRRGAAAPAGRG